MRSEKYRLLSLLERSGAQGVKRSDVSPPLAAPAIDGGPAMVAPGNVVNALRDDGHPIDSTVDGRWILRRELYLGTPAAAELVVVEAPEPVQPTLGRLGRLGRGVYDSMVAA